MNKPLILCIEDDERQAGVLADMLARSGFSVVTAATGAAGLDALAQRPDAVVLDVGLPDMDGFDVCKRMRARDYAAHIPILHLSGEHTDSVARVTGLESGADAYLTKPVEYSVLIATLRAMLRIRASERALDEALTREREQRRKADAASLARTGFLANVSRGLLLPLEELSGHLALLRDSPLDPGQCRHVVEMDGVVGRLAAEMRLAIDFAALDVDAVCLRPSIFDIGAVICDHCRRWVPVAQSKGVSLRVAIAPGVPARVVGDHERTIQLFALLLGHAIRESTGGDITVGLAAQRDGDAWQIHGTVTYVVAGLESTAGQGGGASPALDVVNRLAQLMGGCLRFEGSGAPGVTAIVDVRLGCAPEVESGFSVLLGFEDRVSARIVTRLVEQLGGRVTLADPAHAVPAGSFDVAVVDLRFGEQALRDQILEKLAQGMPVVGVIERQSAVVCKRDGLVTIRWPLGRQELAEALSQLGISRMPAALPRPDLDVPAAIERIGDEGMFREVATLFLSEMPRQILALDAALEAQDADGVREQAHALRGTAANLGGVRLSQLAGEIEAAAAQGYMTAAVAARCSLDAAVAQVRSALAPYTEGPVATAMRAEATRDERMHEGQCTVLLVDDSAAMRVALRSQLKSAGVRVVGEASSGREAIDACREHRPDIVFLDVIMPGMPGVDVVAAIREISPETQVVMLTSISERAVVMQAKALGVADYILKPVATADLIAKIRRLQKKGSV